MKSRYRANPRYDRKKFSRTAMRVHKKNYSNGPMRGGIRL